MTAEPDIFWFGAMPRRRFRSLETGGEKVLQRLPPMVPTKTGLAAHMAFLSRIKEPVRLLP